MIYAIYAIRDAKVGFLSLTVEQNDAVALRNFEHAKLNAQSLMFSHPGDFDLYKLGNYNTDTGEIIPLLPTPVVFDGGNQDV
uniref:Nonstructural protein n=1 Tax=Dulem virus 166 TaxID=3145643 RepID=A0AAU8AYL0_9VIRU